MQKIDKKIGILGGGQLGKMLLEASVPLSLDISIMDKQSDFPSGKHTDQFTEGDFTDYDNVLSFGKDKDILTIEIESVNLDALYELEKRGIEVYPQPRVLEIIKDKGLQKEFYKEHGFPTSDFNLYANASEIKEAVIDNQISLPFVQKARKGGYDGKGVQIVRNVSDLGNLLDTPSIVESLVDIETEMAVIVARTPSNNATTFPMAEMEFHPNANLVEFLFSPSNLSNKIQEKAAELAKDLAQKLDVVGLLAVEFFLSKSGDILINEVAPRPHNSGHHFIESSYTSQFSQLLRAILDLPLGSTRLRQPGVMVNLIGDKDYTGKPIYKGLETLLGIEGVYPHIYGKTITKPYRKMGHVTIINDNLNQALTIARKIKNQIRIIS
jgi:5-(carboxyamino)imidazole ribonucleotide synthase